MGIYAVQLIARLKDKPTNWPTNWLAVSHFSQPINPAECPFWAEQSLPANYNDLPESIIIYFCWNREKQAKRLRLWALF